MPKISDAVKDARRSQILAAAVRCFARDGFQRATIHDICAEAGLSVGAVYGYFGGKDAIIAALSDSSRRATADLVAASRAAGSPLDRLRTLLAALERPQSVTIFQIDVRAWAEAIGDVGLRESTLRSRADLIGRLSEVAAPLAAERGLDADSVADLVATVIAGCEVRKAIEPAADLGAPIGALLALLGAEQGAPVQ